MIDENKQALEKLNRIIQRDGNPPLTDNEYEKLEEVYSFIKALHPKPVDVDEIKLDAETWFYQKEGDVSVCDKVCPILNEYINYLHSQGHLNQGWRDIEIEKPKRGECVLITDCEHVGHARFNGNCFHVVASNDFVPMHEIKYWTHKPQPPKSEDE